MNLEGTETARSLMKAFAGESQARNRYTFYAQIARKEGLIQIAQIFQLTAANEEAHAKEFFKAMNEGNLNKSISRHIKGLSEEVASFLI